MSDAVMPVDHAIADPLGAGRAAFARHAWQGAFELLTRADAAGSLEGSDLESLATAAFFAGRADLRRPALERAFAAYQRAGEAVRAAFVALQVASTFSMQGKTTVATAWARRAERLLDGHDESYAHGFLALMKSDLAKKSGDIPRALELVEEAVGIGERTGHQDLHAFALAAQAALRIATGAIGEGIGLLEEAAIAAVNGELSPLTAGTTACMMISACRDLTDYRRASEWIEMTDRWCETESVGGFPGVCRLHRAEIVALQGGWQRATEELRQATEELQKFDAIPVMADGLYAIADIQRLQGDLKGAEEVLRQAHALGRSPQPALALIRLESGKVKSAAAAIEAALAESSWDAMARLRLLGAQVEISLKAGDLDRARDAVEQLAELVEEVSPPAMRAGLAYARGRVMLAEGDEAESVRELGIALRLWREVGSMYEIARTRAALSRALRATGDDDDADLELHAAREEFERLGAKPDLAAAETELRELEERRASRTQVRMAFLFTDIVGSTRLAEALGDHAWERLLRWHDEMLRAEVARQGGRIVHSTGDGFFAAFDTARQAIRSAIAIQRALASHAMASGFAPPVRIGLHAAEATQRGDDFSGVGVHVAARIAALAGGGEILASADALAAAGEVATSNLRNVEIRGVSEPISIASVAWAQHQTG
ncbi:MAG TPA: adenylate/guanylate cyclase domain-containing protein [Propionibacteriaceae bacterium]|nr:adenylate/guanylate cyclase domain-containing protein [Propionibacteriaceae bacterium]